MEWEAQKPVVPKEGNVRKLNLVYPQDQALFLQKSQIPNPFSAVAVMGNSTIQFHCDYFLSDGVYYLEDFDAIAVAEQEGDTLTCYDIFCEGGSLDEILAVLAAPGTNSVNLGFSPNDTSGFEMIPVSEGDEPFVLTKNKDGIFGGKKLRFPLLSHT